MSQYRIFIDDERDPPRDGKSWHVARTLDQAVEIMKLSGAPSFISFDHDLGANQPTGQDIAKWLVQYDLNHNILGPDFDFYVHSQNPVGAANIKGLLNNYLKFKFKPKATA